MENVFKNILKRDYDFIYKLNKFDQLDEYKYNLLDFSILKNDIELFSYLIDKVNINNINVFGENSLFLAIRKKNLLFIDLLIKNNIDIDLKNKIGETPFLLALKLGDIQIIEFLIKSGVKVNTINNNGQGNIHYYLMGGNYKDINYIVDLLNVNFSIKDNYNNTLLHYAAKYSNPSILKFFIEKNININLVNQNNQTPLYVAILNNNLSNIKFLLKYDNFLNIKDKQGNKIIDFLKQNNLSELSNIIEDLQEKNKYLKKYTLIEDVINNDYLKLKLDLKLYLSVKDNYNLDEYDYALLLKRKKIIKLISDYRNIIRKEKKEVFKK